MSVFKPYQYKKGKADVQRGAPQKNAFFHFFELYFRKFWKYVAMNALYFIVTLPILFYYYLTVSGYLANLLGEAYEELFVGIGFYATVMAYIPMRFYTPMLLFSVVLYGPLKMGVTYVYRNFAREEHAWLSDLFTKAWENFRQGLFFGILDFLVVMLLLNNIVGLSGADSGAALYVILRVASILLLTIYLFMRHYFYMMAVTVNLGVFAILKNALLFVVMGFGRNVLATLACVLIWAATLFVLPLVTVFALPLVTYALCGFATVFICYPTVKKYIVLPAMEQAEKEAAARQEFEKSSDSNELF